MRLILCTTLAIVGCGQTYGPPAPGVYYPETQNGQGDTGGQSNDGSTAQVWDVPGTDTGSSGVDVGQGDIGLVDGGKTDTNQVDVTIKDTTAADVGTKDAGTKDTGPVDVGSTGGSGGMTSASCLDGQYSESGVNPNADLSALTAGYSAANGSDFVDQALQLRYPTGQWIMDSGAKFDMGGKNCVQTFWQASQAGSASDALMQASTLVHECGHLFDNNSSSFGSHTYIVRADLKFTCSGLSYQGTNAGFARSLIKQDAYGAAWPACANFGDQGCDGYAPIYLNGNPTDGQFDSGDQGFDMLLEENTQYVNSLIASLAFANQVPYSVSAEDGILTFLWYVERYLHMARTQYPAVYAYLSSNTCWRQAILTNWGRAWFYLNQTKGNNKLNLDGPHLRGLVATPELLNEIELLRQAEGCG